MDRRGFMAAAAAIPVAAIAPVVASVSPPVQSAPAPRFSSSDWVIPPITIGRFLGADFALHGLKLGVPDRSVVALHHGDRLVGMIELSGPHVQPGNTVTFDVVGMDEAGRRYMTEHQIDGMSIMLAVG